MAIKYLHQNVPLFQWMLLIILSIGIALPAWATPPTEIILRYDLEKNILTVDALHVSSRIERHFLRKMEVFVNGQSVKVTYYHRQVDPLRFNVVLPLVAQPEDEIAVELSCSQGGVKREEISVSKPDPEVKESEASH